MSFKGPDAEQDRGGRIPAQYLGRIGRRNSISGRKLGKTGEQRRLAPDLLVELPIDRRLDLQAWNPHGQFTRPTVIRGRRVDGIGIQKEK